MFYMLPSSTVLNRGYDYHHESIAADGIILADEEFACIWRDIWRDFSSSKDGR
jgi:hypothetical protein